MHDHQSARHRRDEPDHSATEAHPLASPLLGPGGFAGLAQAQELQALQLHGGNAPADAHGIAAQGVTGGGQPLPHGDRIQAAFGHHDVSDVQAHVGGAAAAAASALNAQAYATGRSVAFAQTPDLHLAAHEAAHVVQQRHGVSLKGGVGQAGDAHERHADAIADAVVAGRSAEGLLDQYRGSSGSSSGLQLKEAPPASGTPAPPRDVSALSEHVLTAIAQKETRQRAIESHADTSAGVKASYASQVQGTAPWTITALKKLPAAERKKLGVTLADLRKAEARARAAGALWNKTMNSGAAPIATLKADAGVKKALGASGLTEADLERMVAFRDLRVVMDQTADAELESAAKAKGSDLTKRERRKAYTAASKKVVKDKHNTSLGMGRSSLRTYMMLDKEPKRSAMWREDMAGWQRKAVETGPEGQKIARAATADAGLDLGRARIGALVKSYLAQKPQATDEEVVHHVAKRHNPGARGYPESVVRIWKGQSKTRAKEAAKAKAEAEKAQADAPEADAAATEEGSAE